MATALRGQRGNEDKVPRLQSNHCLRMVTMLLSHRAKKQMFEDNNETSSEDYRLTCQGLERAEERVGKDWDGVTVLEDKNIKPLVVMPDHIFGAVKREDIESVLSWSTQVKLKIASMPYPVTKHLHFQCYAPQLYSVVIVRR